MVIDHVTLDTRSSLAFLRATLKSCEWAGPGYEATVELQPVVLEEAVPRTQDLELNLKT